MNSERDIVKRLFESDSLNEKTYTVGNTQYWCRSGKYYKWSSDSGRQECSEDEYYKAISSINKEPKDDKARERNPVVSSELANHFDEENAKMDGFLHHPKFDAYGSASIQMSNEQIFETMTKSALIKYINDLNSYASEDDDGNKYLPSDTSIAIEYSNGSTLILGDSDPIPDGRIKTRGITSYIEDNGYTTVIYGNVKVENYNEILAGEKNTRYGTSEYEDDWRADFA